MKNTIKSILITFLIMLFCAVGALTKLVINQSKTIADKQQNILKLDSLQKLTEKLNRNKDSLLLIDENIMKQCEQSFNKLKNSLPTNSIPVTGFTFGEKKISLEELLKITNSTLKENISLKRDLSINKFKLNTIKDKFGLSYKDTVNKIVLEENPKSLIRRINKLNEKVDSLNDDLILKKRILSFINKSYHIPYYIKDGVITIPDNKLDTLIDIYPLIKKRIRIKNGKMWLSLF